MEVRALLGRGLLVGLLAGVVAFGFAFVAGEPSIGRAIAFEERHDADDGDRHGADPVSRDVQSTVGLALGTVAVGVALGGLFALVFAFVHGRVGPPAPRASAALIAAAAVVSVYLVPFLKYPASPPAVGDPDTIGHRTELYFALITLSVLSAMGAVVLWRRLRPRLDAWDASIVTGVAYVAVVALTYAALPDTTEVPVGFPAATLWTFRVASLGIHIVMWATIGLAFGALTERAMNASARARGGADARASTPA